MLPGSAEVFDPFGYVFQRSRFERAWPPLGFTTSTYQPGVLENPEVFGDGGRTNREWLRKLFDRCLSLREARENGSASGIGKSGKGSTQLIHA